MKGKGLTSSFSISKVFLLLSFFCYIQCADIVYTLDRALIVSVGLKLLCTWDKYNNISQLCTLMIPHFTHKLLKVPLSMPFVFCCLHRYWPANKACNADIVTQNRKTVLFFMWNQQRTLGEIKHRIRIWLLHMVEKFVGWLKQNYSIAAKLSIDH